MKATLDPDYCGGCGLCVNFCPDVFQRGRDGVEVVGKSVPPEHETLCQRAHKNCPCEAISLN